MPHIDANRCNFYYEDLGSGHELAFTWCESRHLSTLTIRFKNSAKVIGVSHISHITGVGTERPSYGYSLENQTRDLVSLKNALKIRSPVTVSIAFGNTIASNFAIKYPGSARALLWNLG